MRSGITKQIERAMHRDLGRRRAASAWIRSPPTSRSCPPRWSTSLGPTASRALQPLDARQGLLPHEDHVRLRPLQNLRTGDQRQSLAGVPAGHQRRAREQDGHRPRAGPHRLLQEQRVLRATPTARCPSRWPPTPSASPATSSSTARSPWSSFLDAALAIKEHIAPTPDNAPPRPRPDGDRSDGPTGTPYDDVLGDRRGSAPSRSRRTRTRCPRSPSATCCTS